MTDQRIEAAKQEIRDNIQFCDEMAGLALRHYNSILANFYEDKAEGLQKALDIIDERMKDPA